MKHIRLVMAVTLLLVIGSASVAMAPMVGAASSPQSTVCNALGSSADCSQTPAGTVGLDGTISAVVNILSLIVGVVSVIMIIVGGFRFIVANGDSNSISSARSTILYAIIGLVIVSVAQAIVQFVLRRIS